VATWLGLVIPIALLAIVLLVGFVGCQLVFPVDEYEDEENTGTTTGGGPADFVEVGVEIVEGCDAVVNAVEIDLSTDITTETASFTVTTISSQAQMFSTLNLNIPLDAEGQVFCAVGITPAEGEPPSVPPATHSKVKGELVAPFKLSCENGFELT
jgi:hypothetical protein